MDDNFHGAALAFLQALYPDDAPGWLNIYTLPDKHSEWFPPSKPDAVVRYITQALRSPQVNIYFCVGLHGQQVTDGKRGDAANIIAIPALHADIDIAHHTHKKAKLPPSRDAAHSLLKVIPFAPSIVINSGHGIQVYWLLRELWRLENDLARQEATQLLQRLQATIHAAAKLEGWTIDSTFDLSRLLRLPGTYNCKESSNSIPVTILEAHPDRRFNPSDFDPYLIEVTSPAGGEASTEPLPEDLPLTEIHALKVSTRVKYLIKDGEDRLNPGRYPSRSETLLAVIRALIRAEYDDATIAAVLLDPSNRISEKPRDRGRRWLEQELRRVRAKPLPPLEVTSTPAAAREDQSGEDSHHTPNSQGHRQPSMEEEHFTDLGNARRFVRLWQPEVRYIATWQKWVTWTGTAWQIDHTKQVERLARQTVKAMYAEAAHLDDDKARKALASWAMQSESRGKLEAMIALAQAELPIPITHEQLDTDPWAFNCANGTIDLRTGTLRPHRRDDLFMKQSPVPYDPQAFCPRWVQFLHETMAGDKELVSYIQRAVGSSLTADVRDQCLFFLHGGGSNGKSVLLLTLLSLMADYGMQSIPELLMVRSNEQHPTERADLFAKRFVATVEVESGKALAETLVKQLTGGDRIRARRMREDFWEFSPTHKLWFAANHKPVVRGTDHAIWRRIKLTQVATYKQLIL